MKPRPARGIFALMPSLMLLLLTTASANPWVKDLGEWYIKSTGGNFVATDYVDPQVDQGGGGLDYTAYNATLYAEAGVVDGLMVHLNAPYQWAANTDAKTGWVYRQQGFGDLLFGVNADLPGVEQPASAFVRARLPLYADGDRPLGYPAMGDPQVDLDLQANIAHGLQLGPHTLWGIAEGGFRWRTGWTYADNVAPFDYVNGLPYRAQVGFSPSIGDRSLGWVTVDASGLVNLKRDDFTRQWHQVNLGVAGNIDQHVAVEAGWQQIYAARASSLGWGLTLGVSHRR